MTFQMAAYLSVFIYLGYNIALREEGGKRKSLSDLHIFSWIDCGEF